MHGHLASKAPGKALLEAEGATILYGDSKEVYDAVAKSYAPWLLEGHGDLGQQPSLPEKLPVDPANAVVLDPYELQRCIQRTAAGSSPGKCGWTRELLTPAGLGLGAALRVGLAIIPGFQFQFSVFSFQYSVSS